MSAIRVGHRYRCDLGDVDALAASVYELGLLQPITITPDGTLVCGARCLAAVEQLGWTHISVWVCSGVSTRLHLLFAELHDNTARKQVAPTESARLYREAKH